MIINESGLCKAIKSAWKSGYDVVPNMLEDRLQLTIYGGIWMVRAFADKLPRKALALLVEHSGTIPTDIALRVIKDVDNQTLLTEVITEDFRLMGAASPALPIPLNYKGACLYQQDDRQIILVNTSALRIFEFPEKGFDVYEKSVARQKIDDEEVRIRCMGTGSDTKLNHLEQIDWLKDYSCQSSNYYEREDEEDETEE